MGLCRICQQEPKTRAGRVMEGAVRCEPGCETCKPAEVAPAKQYVRTADEAVFEAVAAGCATSYEVAERIGSSRQRASKLLRRLNDSGRLARKDYGSVGCFWVKGTPSPFERVKAATVERARHAQATQPKTATFSIRPHLSAKDIGKVEADMLKADFKAACARRRRQKGG